MPRIGADRIAPVRKSVTVRWDQATAFRRFTERIADWWPVATHSVCKSGEGTVTLEPRIGGRLYEAAPDGTEHPWGTVTEWDPPHRVAFTWHPGRPVDTRQEVAIAFRPAGAGCRLDLVHTGWERLGERGAETRAGYVTGWDFVLGRFAG